MAVITKAVVDQAAALYRSHPSRANRIELRHLAADHAIALEDARVAHKKALDALNALVDHQKSFTGIRDLGRHEPYLKVLDEIRDARRAVRSTLNQIWEIQS